MWIFCDRYCPGANLSREASPGASSYSCADFIVDFVTPDVVSFCHETKDGS
jgi:hypothetical protein